MQTQQLQGTLSISRKRFQFVIRFFWCRDFNQLDFVELMHPDDPPSLAPCGASLTPKTRSIGNKFLRKIGDVQNFIAIKIREWYFGGRCKEKLVFFQPVHVSLEFRQLRCANHAIASDQKWRADLAIAVFPYVQVDHEIDQRTFQFCACAREADETTAAQFRSPFQVEKLQVSAK